MAVQENRRSKMTRKVFRESLTELMLEKGLQKISVNEICKRADMNRSTFYAHYEDQYDLLREIEDDFLNQLKKTVLESDLQNFSQKFEGYLGYLYRNGKLFCLLLQEDGGFRSRILESAFFLYGQRKESGEIPYDDPLAKQKLLFMSGGSLLLLEKWINAETPVSEIEIAKTLYVFWDRLRMND